MSHPSRQETELMNIETAHHREEDKIRVLYEASYKGCVPTLNSLLQEDPGILQKISSQTIFIETPLHISASHGHLEFTKTLLSHKPELALERNSSRSTPLHLASAEGHIEVVMQLLKACEEACLVLDQEGRIPLHYAIIRGRRDVVLELIKKKKKKPESLKILDDKGKTIFHLCVTYNQLDILKDLIELNIDDTHELLIKSDKDGNNTILHLAILLKQVETVRYLLSIRKIRSEALNLKNDMGYTAADIVERIPKDSKSLEIQVILMECGIKFGRRERLDVGSEEDRPGKKRWSWRNVFNVFKSIDRWLEYNGDWLEDMRGNLSLVATVISTITFQAALNPPGSVIQQGIRPGNPDFNLTSSFNTSLDEGPLGCLPYKDEFGRNRSYGPCPGVATHAYRYPDEFRQFIVNNTISFVASLCVALLLVGGVPLKRRFVMGMLSIGMCIALTCLLNAYFAGLNLIIPCNLHTGNAVIVAAWIFSGLYVLVGIYRAVIFVKWVVGTLKEKIINRRKSK
ncbi:ankyrin repeat-containing protein At2g01680-like [Prosopis cineraria]|uniref:ankyrin repeat-containing protein At2g01680-like n=1 Tax=Prosopis cineraria TaxID=364024 RepID=UPI00240FB2BD|nr:ankyrin repeat-containing protein At2g01680-like [Prosopis cineraria]